MQADIEAMDLIEDATGIMCMISMAFDREDGSEYDAAEFKDKAEVTLDVANRARRWLQKAGR